jgi:lipoprotein signal peptidase
MAQCRGSFRSRLDLSALIYATEHRSLVSGLPVRTRDLSRTGIGITIVADGADRQVCWPRQGELVRVAVNDTFDGYPLVRQWTGRVAHVPADVDGACARLGIAFEWPDGRGARSRAACPVSCEPPWAADRGRDLDAEHERSAAGYARWASAVALAGFTIDQLTKTWAASAVLGLEGQRELVLDLLAVVPRENAGALASLAADSSLTGPVCALGCLAVVGLSVWRGRLSGPIGGLGGGLLAAGMLGNSADRLALGHVRDFLVSHWVPCWVFNIADVFIVVGALCWLGTRLVNSARGPLLLPSSVTSLDARRSATERIPEERTFSAAIRQQIC